MCDHKKGYTFKKTKLGVRRTCRSKCGFSVTEVAVPHESILDRAWKPQKIKGKHYKE